MGPEFSTVGWIPRFFIRILNLTHPKVISFPLCLQNQLLLLASSFYRCQLLTFKPQSCPQFPLSLTPSYSDPIYRYEIIQPLPLLFPKSCPYCFTLHCCKYPTKPHLQLTTWYTECSAHGSESIAGTSPHTGLNFPSCISKPYVI